jgi:hypothetical protein
MKEHIPVLIRVTCPCCGHYPSYAGKDKGKKIITMKCCDGVRPSDNPDKFKRKRRCDSRYERLIAGRRLEGGAELTPLSELGEEL